MVGIWHCCSFVFLLKAVLVANIVLEVYSSMWSMFSMCIAVRSISGHKAAICSLDFHRYGDILASGSMDTNLKVQQNFILCVYIHLASVQGFTVFIACSTKFCINFILRVTNAVKA